LVKVIQFLNYLVRYLQSLKIEGKEFEFFKDSVPKLKNIIKVESSANNSRKGIIRSPNYHDKPKPWTPIHINFQATEQDSQRVKKKI
jgi:hypothetical protein